MIDRSHLDPRVVTPRRLLYFTEPARAIVDLGLLAYSAPLLAALPRPQTPGTHPVLVLPGLGAGDSSTLPLRTVLRQLGYRTYGWRLGRNVGPTARAVNGLRARLQDLHARSSTAVSLIGCSVGGIYARQLARRTPDAVRQVITLGSPVGLNRTDSDTPDRDAADAQRPANRLFDDWSNFPRWPRFDAWAHWYAGLHAETSQLPLEVGAPLPVPTTSIYSTLDGIVGWRACLNAPAPHTENVPVHTSHFGLAHHPAVIWVIADRLAQPAGQWTPFRPPPLLRAAYRQPEG